MECQRPIPVSPHPNPLPSLDLRLRVRGVPRVAGMRDLQSFCTNRGILFEAGMRGTPADRVAGY
jgi:hypothetical protein